MSMEIKTGLLRLLKFRFELSLTLLRGRRGGLMVSALDSGASGPGSSPDRGHRIVFLGKTQCLSPPRCINGYR